MSILNALKGITNEYEVQRVLGAFGTVVYASAAPVFVAVGIIKDVSLTEFSLAFPAGLAACIGATAGAIALKDRQTATAKVIEQTGAQPGQAALGAQAVQPVEVVNTTSNPVQTEAV